MVHNGPGALCLWGPKCWSILGAPAEMQGSPTVDKERFVVNLDEAEVSPKAENFVVENGKVRLRASKCGSCGAVFYPPRSICPGDGTSSMEDALLSSAGTVYTFTVARQSTPEFRTPYVLVYVDFPENVRVLLPFDGSEPPSIGAKVEIVMANGPRQENDELISMPHAKLGL